MRWRNVIENVSRGLSVNNLEGYSEKSASRDDDDAFVYQRQNWEKCGRRPLKEPRDSAVHARKLFDLCDCPSAAVWLTIAGTAKTTGCRGLV